MSGLGIGRRELVRKIVAENWATDRPEGINFSYDQLLFVLQEVLTDEGKPYFERRLSQRGFKVFKEFVKLLLYRNIANYDSMILISSDKGTGKSSAAIMIARFWCKLLGIRFDPKVHIAYTNAQVAERIQNLPKFSPLIADESVNFATSESWNKRENKELKKMLAVARTKHLLFILCFPFKVYKIDKIYLESLVNYWIDLFGRGIGAIYVKDKNPIMDTWRLADFKNIGSYTEFSDLASIEAKLKKHPNFWSIIRFPKPPKWLYEKYLMVREKNVYDDDNVLKHVSKEDIYNALLILTLRDVMLQDSNISINRVVLHIKNQYDISLPKGLIQRLIDDARQLVAKVREQNLLDSTKYLAEQQAEVKTDVAGDQ